MIGFMKGDVCTCECAVEGRVDLVWLIVGWLFGRWCHHCRYNVRGSMAVTDPRQPCRTEGTDTRRG